MKIVEYTETAAAIAVLREKYCTVFDVTTSKGMDEAKKARAEVRSYRVSLEKVRKEIKAPALERSRLIDEEAKRITAELQAIEEPIDEQIKAEERRKEEEKAAKARAEAARLAGIAAKVSALRNLVSLVANQPAEIIENELDKAQTLELLEADYQEFMPDALEALTDARNDLQAALNTRLLYEAEQARIKAEQEAEAARMKAEREELARLRELEAARQAEQARIEAEARQEEEARLKAEREAQEAELKAKREAMEEELKAQREEQARQEQIARQIREAEEARLKTEREEQARKDEEIRQQQAAETARIKAEQEAMEQQRAELAARQHQIEEAEQKAQAEKFKKRGKVKADLLADLKQALNADEPTAQALDEAYQRGFKDGLNSAQQAA
jgi:colicin import membrane protein